MQLPLTLRLRPSPILAAALVLAHSLAAAGLAPTNLPFAVKLPLWAALALSLAFHLRRHVLRPSVTALTLASDDHLEFERPDGTRAMAQVQPHTTVFSWLIVLLLEAEGRTLALTLPRDALDADGHRQLRLWLRWKAATG